jgi:hypothetical protein
MRAPFVVGEGRNSMPSQFNFQGTQKTVSSEDHLSTNRALSQETLPKQTRTYHGFFVSVQVVSYTPGKLSRCPLVKVSVEKEGEPIVMLFSTVEFPTDQDAVAYGFLMGTNWIDTR